MSYAEIKGSRETTAEGKITTGVILGVSDDGAGGADAGDYYTGDSGKTGKVCMRAKVTPEVIPGIWLHTDQYLRVCHLRIRKEAGHGNTTIPARG